jgi:hypothetical protein
MTPTGNHPYLTTQPNTFGLNAVASYYFSAFYFSWAYGQAATR